MPLDVNPAPEKSTTDLAYQVMNAVGLALLASSFSKSWRFEYVNPAFCQLVGRPAEDLVGMSMEDLIHPEDLPKLRGSRERWMTGEATSHEVRLVKPDGEKVHVQITGSPRLRDGDLEGSIIVVSDLTERIRSEQRVEASEHRLADIINFLPDPSFVIDKEGRVTAWNRAMEGLTGIKAEDMLGKGDYEYALPFYGVRRPILIDLVLRPDEEFDRMYDRVQREGEVVIAEIYIPSFKPGRSYLWGKASPLYDTEGLLVGAIESIRDITDRTLSEMKLQESEARLRNLNRQIEYIFGATKTGLDIIDAEFNIRYIDPEWAKVYGDPKGQKCYEYFMGRTEVCPTCGITKALETKEMAVTEEILVREGNRPIQITTIPFQDINGEWLVAEVNVDISERKSAEQAIRESEEKYRKLVERANDGITIIQDGVIKFVNRRLAEMWGGTVEEVLGSTFTDYIHPDYVLKVADRYHRRIAEEEIPSIYETVLRRRDGSKVYAELSAGLITFQGEPANLVIVRDLTERRRVDEALRKSEQEKAAILGGLKKVFVEYLDPQMRIIWVNRAVQKSLDLPMEKLKGKHCFEVIQDINAPCPGCTVKTVCETGQPQEGELATPDGKIWISHSNPIIGADGRVAGVVHVAVNITDRTRAEEARLAAEERYRHLVENLYDIVFTLDLQGTFTYISPVIEQIFGYTADDVLGQHFGRFIFPEDLPNLLEIFEGSMRGRITTDRPLEFRIVNKGKEVRYVRFSGRPLLKDDTISGLTGVLSDITERKLAEEALRKAHDELELRVKERTEELECRAAEMERFVYTVSHDLRSPLVTVSGFLGFLKKDLDNGDLNRTKTDLRLIEDAIIKMDHLLLDTLELSRVGRITNPPKDVAFGEIVKEAFELTANMLRSRGVEVSVAQDLPVVHVDRMRIVEVLVNLIENSVRYMGDQPQPKIWVGHWLDGAETVFFVRDNGIGIDPSQCDKVFGLFYKLDNKGEGSGAGLAIVKRIIEVHGGRIWMESELGKGCTACFTLPVT